MQNIINIAQKVAIQAAKDAGELIKHYYSKDKQVVEKGDPPLGSYDSMVYARAR